MIRLQNDDLLLLKYLFETDFLDRDQIKKYIWNNRGEKYSIKRLWQLTKEEILKKAPNPDSVTGSVLMATSKALLYMKNNIDRIKDLRRNDNFKFQYISPGDYRVQNELRLGNFRHDNLLNLLRFKLEDYGADGWVSDKILFRNKPFKYTPDGLFQKKKKFFAVEFEIYMKRNHRYQHILHSYDTHIGNRNDRLDYLIYFCFEKQVYDFLSNRMRPDYQKDGKMLKNYNRMFLIRWGKFMEGDLRIYNHYDKRVIDLKEEVFS